MPLKEYTVDIEKPDGTCSLTFVVDELLGLFLHSFMYFYIHFWYWLNSNILVAKIEGKITLQKSIFTHTFLCNFFFFLLQKKEANSDNKNHNDV